MDNLQGKILMNELKEKLAKDMESDNLEDYIDPKHRIVYNSEEVLAEVDHCYQMIWDGKKLRFTRRFYNQDNRRYEWVPYLPEKHFIDDLITKGMQGNGKK